MGMKASSNFFKGTIGNPAAGDISFMSDNDDFQKNIRKRKDVDPDGKFDLISHGKDDAIELAQNGKGLLVNSRTVAKLLKTIPGYKKGQSIRLLSCNTGSLSQGFAQNLANKLGVTVWAPNKYLWAYPSGKHFVAGMKIINGKGYPNMSDMGRFIKFIPGGNRK